MAFEFAMHFPKPPLDRHVESLTFYSGFAPQHDREKLLPDGAIQIIVDLTDTPKKLYAGETSDIAVDFSKAWISGMHRRWIVIEAQQAASMLVIRFRPGGSLAFVPHAASAFTNTVHSLAAVLGRNAASLRDRILEATTIDAKFAAAETWLLEQASGDLALSGTAAFLARRLGTPSMRVRDLVDTVGLSERQARNIFHKWVGLSPKQFARVSRFQSLLAALVGNAVEDPAFNAPALPPPDWARLAADLGYADQSHLSHEFMAFAGMTPGAYASAYRGLTNYLPITLAADFRFLQDGTSLAH
ncbi:MAG: helix-turn-helix domain-containing protein [Devosia sp.]